MLLLLVLAAAGGAVAACSDDASGAGTGTVHEDVGHAFIMAFPDDFTVSTDAEELAPKSYFPLDDGSMRLGGCYSGEDYAGTNFGSACIVVSVSQDAEPGRDCARFEGDTFCGEKDGVRDAVVNGQPFKRADMSDAAMGHRLEARDYWTVHGGQRYDIRLFVTYTAIEMYTPGEKQAFSPEDCWSRLTRVLNTFSFR